MDGRINSADSLQQLLGHNLKDFLTNLAENGPTRQKTGLTETAMEAEDERPSVTTTTPSIPGPPSTLFPSFNSANSHRQALKPNANLAVGTQDTIQEHRQDCSLQGLWLKESGQ